MLYVTNWCRTFWPNQSVLTWPGSVQWFLTPKMLKIALDVFERTGQVVDVDGSVGLLTGQLWERVKHRTIIVTAVTVDITDWLTVHFIPSHHHDQLQQQQQRRPVHWSHCHCLQLTRQLGQVRAVEMMNSIHVCVRYASRGCVVRDSNWSGTVWVS